MKNLFVYIAGPIHGLENRSANMEGLKDTFYKLIRAGIPAHISETYSKEVLNCCSDLLVIMYKGFVDDRISHNAIDFARANGITVTALNPDEVSNLDNFITVLRNRTTEGANKPDKGKGSNR